MNISTAKKELLNGTKKTELVLENLVEHLSYLEKIPAKKADVAIEQALLHFNEYHLVKCLKSLIRNPDSELSKGVADKSYLHGNGFYKLVLFISGKKEKLRIHFWPGGVDAEENIHCHRWSFSSLIIHGKLNSEIYKEDSSRDANSHKCYLYRKTPQEASSIFLGDIKLSVENKKKQKAGDFYRLPQGKLHRIIGSDKGSTATIMYQSSPTKAWNSLITTNTHIKPNLNPPKLTTSQLNSCLVKLVTVLEKK